jgi:pimeloyl-ACP methyl ester carboxylesterase
MVRQPVELLYNPIHGEGRGLAFHMKEISRKESDGLLMIDRHIDHVSIVPAIAGETVNLFVREKVKARAEQAPVVLMVHGGYWPGTMAFDFDYKDYSWMSAMARAGFDVFAMDMTGYGFSSRPLMDDQRNLSKFDQAKLLSDPQPSGHPFNLVTSDSETDDINRVVDFICELRGVNRVNLIGWSGGGIRTGTYTVRHPDKVERLVIFASSNFVADSPSEPPTDIPGAGVAMSIQTRAVGEGERWLPNVRCEGQLEDGLIDLIWPASMATDGVGAGWGPGCLRAPGRTYWGWNAANAVTINTPTLVMVGEYDRLYDSNVELFDALGADDKVFLGIDCASHFMAWEMQRHVLHRASIEWLTSGTLSEAKTGTYRADKTGEIR